MTRRPSTRNNHVIRDPEQLKALRTPIRHRVLNTVVERGRCTVGQIAESLEWKAESLYYHVNALVKVGLLRPVEQIKGRFRSETLFEAVAPKIVLDRDNRSSGYLAAVRDVYRAALRAAERDLENALAAERKGKGPRRNAMLRQFNVRLSAADLKRLESMLDQISDFLAEHEHSATCDQVSLTVVLSKKAR